VVEPVRRGRQRNVRLGRAKVAFSTINDLVLGLETILTVYLAARLALANALTVGMIFAFMSYRQHFTEKAVLLVERALDLRIRGLHLERLSDIALSPLEAGHERPLAYARPIEGRLELRRVFFRYSETDAFVLEDINLAIDPGEFVAITGPSGGGKTTLMKIMLGARRAARCSSTECRSRRSEHAPTASKSGQ
jgi:ATP-binding cassette, subfamily B, bacterial CvaB/MchF/RaxB